MSDDGERTHDPTPQRREEFRKEGRFPRARDAGPVAATFAVLAALLGSRDAIGSSISTLFHRCHGDLDALTRGEGPSLGYTFASCLFVLIVPSMLAAALANLVTGFSQAGFRLDWSSLAFKPERFNPVSRLGEIFSPKHALTETGMSLLRVGVVAYVGYRVMLLDMPKMMTLARLPAAAGFSAIVDSVTRVTTTVLVALALVAVIDYVQNRISIEKQMKMTRHEVQEESKSTEGDAKVKHKMRQRGRALLRKRQLGNVKNATVVVTNPTHYSVALRYGDSDPAPIVVAKGQDEMALEIRKRARRYGVPILENRPLARALYAEVEVGKPIAQAHFGAVARVLAFVYQLPGRARTRKSRAARAH